MIRRMGLGLLLAWSSACALLAQDPLKPVTREAFAQALRELGADPTQLAQFAAEASKLGLSPAAEAAMRRAVPSYDAAVKLHEAAQPRAALALAKVLADATSPLVRAHARVALARVFFASDDPARANELLREHFAQDSQRSPVDEDALWLQSQALVAVPDPAAACQALQRFLQSFPAANEGTRRAALSQLTTLQRQQESRLHQLADKMSRTRRELRNGRMDEPVQVEQAKFLDELQELIEVYEEIETQRSGAPSGNQSTQAPANASALPTGQATIGELRQRVALADRWGDMKDVERDKIAAEVHNQLPPQYRKLLEDYYRQLGRVKRR